MNEEIKIITLGDIFENIENEEKAFKFLNYIKELQQLKKQKDEIVKYIKSFEYYIPEDDKNELLRMLGEIE